MAGTAPTPTPCEARDQLPQQLNVKEASWKTHETPLSTLNDDFDPSVFDFAAHARRVAVIG
jgi:hypothetical protein